LENQLKINKLQLLGKLSASLAHEIRNPLSALKLNLSYLGSYDDLSEQEKSECIESCSEATERIRELVENTLEFSRKPGYDDAECNLNEIIQHSISIMSNFATRKNIQLTAKLGSVPKLNLNKNKILQVFLNLITNAIDASEQNSIVKITSAYNEDEKCIIVRVIDTGSGIKESLHSQIFTDFFTSKEEGTGLGLSVCKMLIDEQKGNISFESKEGSGTTFTIKFYFEKNSVKDEH